MQIGQRSRFAQEQVQALVQDRWGQTWTLTSQRTQENLHRRSDFFGSAPHYLCSFFFLLMAAPLPLSFASFHFHPTIYCFWSWSQVFSCTSHPFFSPFACLPPACLLPHACLLPPACHLEKHIQLPFCIPPLFFRRIGGCRFFILWLHRLFNSRYSSIMACAMIYTRLLMSTQPVLHMKPTTCAPFLKYIFICLFKMSNHTST